MFPVRDPGKPGGDLVVLVLVVLNVVAFLATAWWIEPATRDLGLTPARIAEGEGYATFLTSMFLHAGLAHLVGNMWYLWFFGDNIERRFGPARFLLLYVASGLAGGVAHVLMERGSDIPAVGASGAVSGILAAYLVRFPKNRVEAVIARRRAEVPAYGLLLLWLALQLLIGVIQWASGGGAIAVGAHLGGFAMGALLAALPARRRTTSFQRVAPPPPARRSDPPVVWAVVLLFLVAIPVDAAMWGRPLFSEPARARGSDACADGSEDATSLVARAVQNGDDVIVLVQALDEAGEARTFAGTVRVAAGSETKVVDADPCDMAIGPALRDGIVEGPRVLATLAGPREAQAGARIEVTVTFAEGGRRLTTTAPFA